VTCSKWSSSTHSLHARRFYINIMQGRRGGGEGVMVKKPTHLPQSRLSIPPTYGPQSRLSIPPTYGQTSVSRSASLRIWPIIYKHYTGAYSYYTECTRSRITFRGPHLPSWSSLQGALISVSWK